MSWLRSFGSFGTVLVSSFGSVASEPVAAAPAALGRPWKYFAFVNVWPSSFEPTTLPFTSSFEPFALSENAGLRDPVTTSGIREPEEHREDDHHHDRGQELASHHFTPRAVTITSMSLIPMNGAMIPPSP